MRQAYVAFSGAPPLEVEAAETPSEYMFGLSETVIVGPGMLFDFGTSPDSTPVMWMKQTYVPLDMIFMDATGTVIGIVHSAEPMSRRLYGFNGTRYVLEVPGGWARDYAVDVGSRALIQIG